VNEYSGKLLLKPKNIVIAGSGRSGTTWILDALADSNDMRTIFEPLHPQAIPSARPYSNAYIPRHADAPDLKSYLDGVFSCKTRSVWSDYRVRPDRMMPTIATFSSVREIRLLLSRYGNLWRNFRKYGHSQRSGVITKFIRANLMLGWLEQNFDLSLLFVVRHPGAVVASQLEKGTEWDFRALESFKCDALLWQDYLAAHEAFLKKNLSTIELYTTIWCIQNALPLKEAKETGRSVAYYEKLITESGIEWARIAHSLQLDRTPETETVKAPSQQSSKVSNAGFRNQTYRVSRWQERFSGSDLSAMQRVLDEFRVSVYSAHDVMPLS
jgi:hypothetical protein